MANIQYDPVLILKGFTIDGLKELSRKLKRKIRSTRTEIIQEILSHPRGKPDRMVKVWQEINRSLRKDIEAFSQEALTLFSAEDVPHEERFKVGYMFTLSSNSEIRTLGEEIYCRGAEDDKALENDKELENNLKEAVAVISTTIIDKSIEDRNAQETIEDVEKSELHQRIKVLDNKLYKANMVGQRTKGQLDKLRVDMIALKSQRAKDKEETEQVRNKIRKLEVERAEKDKVIDLLKQKLALIITRRTKALPCGEFDLATYQGRKALIFAERDNEVDMRLTALGIIPIWAMGIDWNRPRRRMSTCQLVLYKQDDEKVTKLDEIRDIARYWNIPCNELMNFSGRIAHD
jgi:hypothetical protein